MKKINQKIYSGYGDIVIKHIKKMPWVLGRNAFLVTMLLVVGELLFGVFLFHVYVVVPNAKESDFSLVDTKFNEKTYELVAGELELREDIASNLIEENVVSPFK